jgi:spore coat protein U-like protein
MGIVSARGFFVATAAVLAAPAAFAAQSTANMNVSLTVTAACNVSVTDINFGSVPASALSAAMTSTAAMGGLFTYTCGSSTTTPSLSAGQGKNYSGGNRMKGSLGSFLPYSLNVPTVAAFTGAAQTAQITATVPAQGTLPAVDTYTDAVVLTLSY